MIKAGIIPIHSLYWHPIGRRRKPWLQSGQSTIELMQRRTLMQRRIKNLLKPKGIQRIIFYRLRGLDSDLLTFVNCNSGIDLGTEIKNTVRAADTDAQYDEKAKKLLGHKYILAYILINTVDEFRGMSPKVAVNYIEGEPKIGVVPVDPGMTNISKEKQGENFLSGSA